MKTTALMMCLVLGLVGCSKGEADIDQPKQTEQIRFSEADPVKRGAIAMDAIYASEQAFMQHGMPGIQTVVMVLQNALSMWPETVADDGINACRMALRIQTTHMLNVTDHLDDQPDEKSAGFRETCRRAINYQDDNARQHAVWDMLTTR